MVQSPVDGSVVTSTQAVELVGIVQDQQGLQDIAAVFWQSDRDGELADLDSAMLDTEGVTRLSTTLSEGVHVVTLQVVDSLGERGEDSIGLQVIPPDLVPRALISQPDNLQRFDPGEEVQLVGSVSDGQQASETLTVRWELQAEGGQILETIPSSADAEGVTIESIIAPGAISVATYDITLVVEDDDGYESSDTIPIVVSDPSAVDNDNDSWPLTVDCDDDDASVNPGAPERCGDAKDNDCNGFIDDKDADADLHVDEACVNYTGALPKDDCLDSNDQVFPGAFEVPDDNVDNDCDGVVDNNGPQYDSDGDCYCEGPAPCGGSLLPACIGNLDVGDCDEGDPTINPGAIDLPDRNHVDANCDGIDGARADAVFVDPVFGNDGNSGLTEGSPKRTLDVGLETAEFQGRSWVLLANGTYDFSQTSDQFIEGISVAGGYDAANGWVRTTVRPEVLVASAGKRLQGWSARTELHQFRIRSASATAASGSSVGLWIRDTTGLYLVDMVVESGNGAPGLSGNDGSDGCGGSDGADGTDGCVFGGNNIFCGQCNDVGESVPVPSPGGDGCPLGGDGGTGGRSGNGDMSEVASQSGAPGNNGSTGVVGGTGGRRGVNNGEDGDDGNPGSPGSPGSNGIGGQGTGDWDPVLGYDPSDGTSGFSGENGSGGGGGGGGAGGGWSGAWCDTYGGSGGGGGEGGARGTGGTGGKGGGASIAIVLSGVSTIEVEGGEIETGNGGAGGRGGTGGTGGVGGDGGNGGSRKQPSVGANEVSGAGGSGGFGGAGGDGGHGGGGGGGPVYGIWCTSPSSSAATSDGPVYVLGLPGTGGPSAGANGANGDQVSISPGC